MIAQPHICFDDACKEHWYGAKLSDASSPFTIRSEIDTWLAENVRNAIKRVKMVPLNDHLLLIFDFFASITTSEQKKNNDIILKDLSRII